MILRQRLEVIILISLSFLAFASYHEGTGGVAWLQWLAMLSIMAFVLIFDMSFTNESNFLFDPDADNWRRKVVSDSDQIQNSYLLIVVSHKIFVEIYRRRCKAKPIFGLGWF